MNLELSVIIKTVILCCILHLLSVFAQAQSASKLSIFFTDRRTTNYLNPKHKCAYLEINNESKARYLLLGPCMSKIDSTSLSGVNLFDFTIQWNGDSLLLGGIEGKGVILFKENRAEFLTYEDYIAGYKYYKIIRDEDFDLSKINIRRRKFNCLIIRISRYTKIRKPFQLIE